MVQPVMLICADALYGLRAGPRPTGRGALAALRRFGPVTLRLPYAACVARVPMALRLPP